MLSDFVSANRTEIIARCHARSAASGAPSYVAAEPVVGFEDGIPRFLAHLAVALPPTSRATSEPDHGAPMHGIQLLRRGFSVAEVVHAYGNTCQTITELAIERALSISTAEFKILNLCLDDSIAEAVTAYAHQREADLVATSSARAVEDLGLFAHELRNLLATATLAYDALQDGSVGITGSTGAVLGRSLQGLRNLVDRSLVVVRLDAGMATRERFAIGALIDEIEHAARMQAKARGIELSVEMQDRTMLVEADRQILASALANLVQNALKYTRAHSHCVLRTVATDSHVRIEVEDECGGLAPGKLKTLFQPFQRGITDHSGLGLGLAISARGVHALGGTIWARDVPSRGCVFTIEIPRLLVVADSIVA